MECLWYFVICWQFVSSFGVLFLTLSFTSCWTWSTRGLPPEAAVLLPLHSQSSTAWLWQMAGKCLIKAQTGSVNGFSTRLTPCSGKRLCRRWVSWTDAWASGRCCGPKGGPGRSWPSPLGGCPQAQHVRSRADLCSIFFLFLEIFPVFKVFSSSTLWSL